MNDCSTCAARHSCDRIPQGDCYAAPETEVPIPRITDTIPGDAP